MEITLHCRPFVQFVTVERTKSICEGLHRHSCTFTGLRALDCHTEYTHRAVVQKTSFNIPFILHWTFWKSRNINAKFLFCENWIPWNKYTVPWFLHETTFFYSLVYRLNLENFDVLRPKIPKKKKKKTLHFFKSSSSKESSMQ